MARRVLALVKQTYQCIVAAFTAEFVHACGGVNISSSYIFLRQWHASVCESPSPLSSSPFISQHVRSEYAVLVCMDCCQSWVGQKSLAVIPYNNICAKLVQREHCVSTPVH